MSMIAFFILFWSQSDSCGQPLLVSIHEDASFIKFVCSGVIVSRDHIITFSECFADQNIDETNQASLQISSGSDFWYGSMNIHRIKNITKVDSIFCIKVTPPFPSCVYDGKKILISDPKQVNNTYRARGWSKNWASRVITRNLNSTQECTGAPGALVIDQNNWLVGFQGVKCIRSGNSRTTEMYYFKNLIGRNDTCTKESFIMSEKYYDNTYKQ